MTAALGDFRNYLKSVLNERVSRNPAYSLRSFARQIDLSPSALCEVLKGTKNLSEETATLIARRLGLNTSEQECFRLSALSQRTKRIEVKEEALQRLQELQPSSSTQILATELFRMISDWQHFAILAATELTDFESGAEYLAKRLGISVRGAEAAVDRLIQLEMLEQDKKGRLRKSKRNPRVISDSPSEALRNFHRQTLNKAIESIDTQTPQEKVIGSETFCIDPNQLEEYRKAADEFFEKMLGITARSKVKTEVYHLGVQFFRFTKKKEKINETGSK